MLFPLSRNPFQLLMGHSKSLFSFWLSYYFFLEVLLDPRETGLDSLPFAAITPCGYLFCSGHGNIL